MEKSDTESPAVQRRFIRWIGAVETVVVCTLILLMMAVVLLSTYELTLMMWRQVSTPPYFQINLPKLLDLLGFFMMVLIGLELLETIKNYLTHHALHVEVVILVAMIAVARKVIILDMKEIKAETILGISALLLSLACSYYLIRKGMRASELTNLPSS